MIESTIQQLQNELKALKQLLTEDKNKLNKIKIRLEKTFNEKELVQKLYLNPPLQNL